MGVVTLVRVSPNARRPADVTIITKIFLMWSASPFETLRRFYAIGLGGNTDYTAYSSIYEVSRRTTFVSPELVEGVKDYSCLRRERQFCRGWHSFHRWRHVWEGGKDELLHVGESGYESTRQRSALNSTPFSDRV